MITVDGLFYTDGGTRVVDGETLACWCVISRSLRGRIFVLFGPVITNEAHLAFSGARTHSNNTAEMTAMMEAIVFPWSSWPSGPGCAVVYLSRFHVCYWYVFGHNPSSYTCAASASMSTFYDPCSTTFYGSPCNTCSVHSGNLGSECADHAAAFGTLGLYPQATTLPLVGFTITLMQQRALIAVTALFRSCHRYSTFGQVQHHFLPQDRG